MNENHIIIYDGVCHFCHHSVNFIIKRDPNKVFRFTPIQSDFAQSLMNKYQLNTKSIDTFILIKHQQSYDQSDAILEITKDLSGYWYLLRFFKILPTSIRNFIYRTIAKNRYRLLGKSESCIIPTDDIKERFIDIL